MRRLWLIFSQAVTVALALLFVVATLKPEWLKRAPGQMLPQIVSIAAVPDGAGAALAPGSLAPAAQRAAPAVVSIAASSSASAARPRPRRSAGSARA
jgi:serine protease DegQ